MDVQTWLKRNGKKLSPKTKYERLFVESVLSRVEDIDLRSLSAQMKFTDADGKRRECDFVIKEGEFVRIAIEVDGFDKTGRGSGMTFKEFLDWQRRQAALTAQCWHVLRFANTDVEHHPERCAELVGLLLRELRQKGDRIADLASKSEQLQAEIEGLRKTRNDHNRQASEVRKELRAELDAERQRAEKARKRLKDVEGQLHKLEHQRKTGHTESSESNEALNQRIAELNRSREALLNQSAEEKARAEERLREKERQAQAAAKQVEFLEQELETVKARLSDATKKSPLAESEKMRGLAKELGKYRKEFDVMKHTIWAFAVVIIAALVTIVVISRPGDNSSSGGVVQEPSGQLDQATNNDQSSSPGTESLRHEEGMRTEPGRLSGQSPSWCQNPTNWGSARRMVGRDAVIAGPVTAVTYRPDRDGQPTWISIGATFPDRDRFDVLIWGRNRSALSSVLSRIDSGDSICVQGGVSEYRGVVQIEVDDPSQLWIN